MSDLLDDMDPGTGLPRLRQALSTLSQLRLSDTDSKTCHGLILITLQANATLLRLAPEASEPLRWEISQRLGTALRPQDRLYALSPWEWLALLPNLPSPAAVSLAMIKVQRACQQPPLETTDSELGTQILCGAVIAPDHGTDPLHLIQSSRIATLHAHSQNDWCALYHQDMEQAPGRQATMNRELQDALAEDRLQLFLQPQVDIATGRCLHAEALLRWQREDGNWVSPEIIVSALERAGLRHSFNRWLFQHAALHLHELQEAGLDITLSVNLTAHDLLDPELPDLVAQALDTWRLPTEGLILEITENVAVSDAREVVAVLHRLRDMNVRLSIDDFGTGYAGMAYLQNLPVQEVKIDQRFILPLTLESKEREIASAVIQLAHKLDMEVVAEGVSTPEALECLLQMGCERAQGFLYSPALPLPEFMAWLRTPTMRADLEGQDSLT